VARQPIFPAVASPCSGDFDDGDRRWLCNDHRFLAAPRDRLCRHNEPDFGRCEHFCAPRADGAHPDDRATPQKLALFARYSVIGSGATALGVLAAVLPDFMTVWTGCTRTAAMQLMFGLYAALGLVALSIYRPLSPQVEIAEEAPKAPLRQSKMLVYGMAALFGMDSFGTGFLVQSLLALWLYQALHVSAATAAAILFWNSLCSAFSYLVAVPIAARIGLINTMVFTHLPSNLLLVLIPLAPTWRPQSAYCLRAAGSRKWMCRHGPHM
jgi:hypothetical protein